MLSGKRLREEDTGVVRAWDRVKARKRERRMEGTCMFRKQWRRGVLLLFQNSVSSGVARSFFLVQIDESDSR